MDPETPIEETIEVLKKLINEGKIKYIGLSECTPSELERANKIHPITAVQMEWSLQTRDIEETVLPMARSLGVGIVPYSPLGRGLLTGTISSLNDLDDKDWRKTVPRFKEDAFNNNANNEEFFNIAKRKGCTNAQLALAWVLAQGNDVIPIPGTKSIERLEENVKAATIAASLSSEEIEEIKKSVNPVVGERYEGMWGTFNQRL
jgi:aryl-alcohol dehydrogenase-like predicted oxidoreductase